MYAPIGVLSCADQNATAIYKLYYYYWVLPKYLKDAKDRNACLLANDATDTLVDTSDVVSTDVGNEDKDNGNNTSNDNNEDVS
jgi:hypothetical protein